MIDHCEMRHENGNCMPAGGFCFCEYNKEICKALRHAYEMGKYNAAKEISEKYIITKRIEAEAKD